MVKGDTYHQLPMPDADVRLYPAFLASAQADAIFTTLLRQIAWQRGRIKLYGREYDIPRLQAWYGDPGKTYTYSGIRMEPLDWTPPLRRIKEAVEAIAGATFTNVLANLYRDGRDSVGWHADDETELGPNPIIASVSLGAVRTLKFKHLKTGQRLQITLPHGSCLLMAGPTQHYWHHELPKTRKLIGPRINLTFRQIKSRSANG